MPSRVMDQRQQQPLGFPSGESQFFHQDPGRQAGFFKPESMHNQGEIEGLSLLSGTKMASPSGLGQQPIEKRSPNSPVLIQHNYNMKNHMNKSDASSPLIDQDKAFNFSPTPWRSPAQEVGYRFNMPVKSSTGAFYENSLFSSSLSEIFDKKLQLSLKNGLIGRNVAKAEIQHGEEEPFEVTEEIEAQTIGNLLPNDEELLSGVLDDVGYVGRHNSVDDIEEDIFLMGGGMELEGDESVNGYRVGELTNGGVSRQGVSNSLFNGEHPYGEHPSRTLFVRNINSNVEDSELKALFEQYGDIRTLYSACKHRGFVMISYYDIRSAWNAMRGLQNKPLRRRKLDIHYSIPKDNPSDKDINQGSLVVLNVDSSVSNEDLHKIFGVFGEIKEIRGAPQASQKGYHKIIEFYDIRAAEAALRALNRIEIGGEKVKFEANRLAGARHLMQQMQNDLEQEDLGKGNSSSSPLGGFGPLHIGSAASNSLHSGVLASMSPLRENTFPSMSSGIPQSLSSSAGIVSTGSQTGQSILADAGHPLKQMNYGLPNGGSFHLDSLPEFHSGLVNGIPQNLKALPAVGMSSNLRTSDASSGTLNGCAFDWKENAMGSRAGSSPIHGQQFTWSNPNTFHPPAAASSSVLWPNSASFSHNLSSHPSLQMHGILRAQPPSHVLDNVLPINQHHVGSAPTINPSLWDRRHAYPGDLVPGLHPGSLGSLGFAGSPQLHSMELNNIFSSSGGKGMEHTVSPAQIGILSPQQRGHMFHVRNPVFPIPSSFDTSSEWMRSRRNDSTVNQSDNKKQYELDIERIVRGDDLRTTLMIKNIPNKYTSKMLLAAIDEKHRGTYDFIYLPIDFKNKCNVGYAFINMVSPEHIIPFHQTFNGKKWEKFNSEKVASLAYARIQGKAALIAHFQNSSLMNEDKRCRPILFHTDGPNAGDQEPFPVGMNLRSRSGKSRSSFAEQILPEILSASGDAPPIIVNSTVTVSGPARDTE